MTENQANQNPEPQTGPAVDAGDAENAQQGGRPATQVEGETADSDQRSLEEREIESRMPGGPVRAPSDPRDSEAARGD